MLASRKTAIAVGVLFLITHVTGVAARLVYGPGLENPEQIGRPGGATVMLFGGLLEVVLALSVVGTAIALYPVMKRQHAGIALGYVALRTLEAGVILVGVVGVLTLVTLRTNLAGASGTDAASLDALSETLVAFQDLTFLVGPGFVCGTNTVLMAYLMYRSGLVPRFIGVLGLVGGPLVFAANVVKMFGFSDQLMPWLGLTVVPVFAWEICLAVYLIARGFRPAGARLGASPALVDGRLVDA